MTRTVTHDQGNYVEVVVYRDGVEVSRATRRKKGLPKAEPKLGDAVESFLSSHGITKEWYIDFKAKFGYPPTCDCPERQEWLNKTAAAHPTIENFGVKLLAAITRKKT